MDTLKRLKYFADLHFPAAIKYYREAMAMEPSRDDVINENKVYNNGAVVAVECGGSRRIFL